MISVAVASPNALAPGKTTERLAPITRSSGCGPGTSSAPVESVGGDKFKVTGDLTIRGVTKEVTLDVEGTPQPLNGPFGKIRMGGSGCTRIIRQDFAVSFSKVADNGGLVVGNDVDATIDVELVKKGNAAR